jgi:hypothetical protein
LYSKKFQNKLQCICKNIVLFEIISDIECDWGVHSVIQCPKCEELFSIDMKCPAFQTIEILIKENETLYTNKEYLTYLEKSHPS